MELSTKSCAYTFLRYSLVDKSLNPHGCWLYNLFMCLKRHLTVEPEIQGVPENHVYPAWFRARSEKELGLAFDSQVPRDHQIKFK